jgi:ferredoxin
VTSDLLSFKLDFMLAAQVAGFVWWNETAAKRGTLMRVVVDLNRCLGYAQCVFLAPSVFKLNGEEALQYDPNPDDATRLKVLRAAAACPVQAILVEHLSGKEGEATS